MVFGKVENLEELQQQSIHANSFFDSKKGSLVQLRITEKKDYDRIKKILKEEGIKINEMPTMSEVI